jgi:hypothetical protein
MSGIVGFEVSDSGGWHWWLVHQCSVALTSAVRNDVPRNDVPSDVTRTGVPD